MPELAVGDVTLAYDRHGDPDAEPVLLVAGMGQPAATWAFVGVPQLVAAGWQVITFDNRGVAPSSVPPAPYTLDELCADAAGLVEALALAPCCMVGYSLGGWVVERLAATRPELVRAAVLGASANDIGRWERLRYQLGYDLAAADLELPPAYDLVEMLSYLPTAKLQDDDVVGLWIDLMGDEVGFPNPGKLGQYAVALEQAERSGAVRDADRAAIRCPTLVLAMEHDWDCPPRAAEAAAGRIPGARFVELAGFGHLALMEDADAVFAPITEFLAGTR